MGFVDLFRPAYKNSKVRVRLEAVATINDQKLLMKLAANDPYYEVRAAAVAKITDESALESIATKTDESTLVRNAAIQLCKNQSVLTKLARDDRNEEVRATALVKITDDSVLESIAKNDPRDRVRAVALARISNQRVLETIATHNDSSSTRAAAVRRLADTNLIRQFLKRDESLNVRFNAICALNDRVILRDVTWPELDKVSSTVPPLVARHPSESQWEDFRQRCQVTLYKERYAVPLLLREFRNKVLAGATSVQTKKIYPSEDRWGISYNIKKAFEIISNEHAIMVLLEMFLALKPSILNQRGFPEEEGDDSGIADVLKKLQGSFALAQDHMHDADYKRLVLLSGCNSQAIEALARLRTSDAITKLCYQLSLGDDLTEELREQLKNTLVSLGSKAYAPLKHYLKERIWGDLPVGFSIAGWAGKQIAFWLALLDVVRQIGDSSFADSLRFLSSVDDPNLETAIKTVAREIDRRSGGQEVIDASAKKAYKIPGIPKRNDPYVDECFHIPWPEYPDLRTSDMLLKGSIMQTNVEEIRLMREKYPDWHGSYLSLGNALFNAGSPAVAIEILRDGLEKSKSKAALCDLMGTLVWRTNLLHLKDAVQWWIRSIVIQISIDNLSVYNPFFYLANIAKLYGLADVAERLIRLQEIAGGKGIVLTRETSSLLAVAVESDKSNSIVGVLRILDQQLLRDR